MKEDHLVVLRRIIKQEFEEGINKQNLLYAMKEFIDHFYIEKVTKLPTQKKQYYKTQTILDTLVRDIKLAGGVHKWKQELRQGIISDVLKAESKQSPSKTKPPKQ